MICSFVLFCLHMCKSVHVCMFICFGCTCVCMNIHMCVCTVACGDWRLKLICSSPYILRQGLSLEPRVADSARIVSQRSSPVFSASVSGLQANLQAQLPLMWVVSLYLCLCGPCLYLVLVLVWQALCWVIHLLSPILPLWSSQIWPLHRQDY